MLAAGLASEYDAFYLAYGDSPQLAAGSFNKTSFPLKSVAGMTKNGVLQEPQELSKKEGFF
jgi:hypothetical protein